jgi:Peptidase_C39 like family
MQKTSSKRLRFPGMRRRRQRTDSHCGPAVLQMLAGFVNVKISQVSVVRALKAEGRIQKYGILVEDIGKAAKKLVPGGVFWYKENSRISDLDKLVNKYKWPVGIEWQGVFHLGKDEIHKNFPDDGHYSIVVGFEKPKGRIYIADPFHEFVHTDRKFDIEFFKKRWWDFNEVKDKKTKKIKQVKDNRMMFVITPKDATFPRELGMMKKKEYD